MKNERQALTLGVADVVSGEDNRISTAHLPRDPSDCSTVESFSHYKRLEYFLSVDED